MGVDVRSLDSGRRSSCLKGVVLALVLIPTISLNAQSGSSQSQPAQSASAPPPAGQDREVDPDVCLVSRWEEHWSKQACSGIAIAIALRAAARRPIVPAAIVRTRFAHSGKSLESEQGRVPPP